MDPIDSSFIREQNEKGASERAEDVHALTRQLERRGMDVTSLKAKLAAFAVAVPSWGVGTGGTRFARFPGPGEPRHIGDKLADCAVINDLTGCCPTVSPHFPWDETDDYAALRRDAEDLGLTFDAVNSNTFQDQPGQSHSYKLGSLTHAEAAVRQQAIEHNIDCIEIGQKLGSKALTIWIADGANFPGQQDFARSFDRYVASGETIYAALPDDWQMFSEHKLFEPAFYATVIADWGTSLMAAQALGPKAKCLIDLGHHAPNTNIEMIVARLHRAGKLGGFHFNDSKYGDDDLDSGSIDPFQLFLVFNELVEAERRDTDGFRPAYMMDQSHNVTDPVESLMSSAEALQLAYGQALLIDREALETLQDDGDVMGAKALLQDAFRTDLRPLVATVRAEKGAAAEPVATFRASGYRKRAAEARGEAKSGGGGIV
ncbi:MAG: L-rhamnose catabolism isomerase [Pseudomonadota bacterium]